MMRRALAVALLASALAAPAAAQDDGWPSLLELRRDLAAVGWTWDAVSDWWRGGPEKRPGTSAYAYADKDQARGPRCAELAQSREEREREAESGESVVESISPEPAD